MNSVLLRRSAALAMLSLAGLMLVSCGNPESTSATEGPGDAATGDERKSEGTRETARSTPGEVGEEVAAMVHDVRLKTEELIHLAEAVQQCEEQLRLKYPERERMSLPEPDSRTALYDALWFLRRKNRDLYRRLSAVQEELTSDPVDAWK